jgi:hypothetical protein
VRSFGNASAAPFALLFVTSAAGLGARPAEAAPPSCFPTRYVGATTSLVGDRIFGTLAPGQVVTLLEDQLPVDLRGQHYEFARIEIDRPVHLTALALPGDLDVFLRHDVPIEPEATWWRAGTAMRVLASHDGRVELDRAGRERQFPVTVGCDDLVADPPGGKAKRDACQACTPEPPLPSRPAVGPPVCWPERSFEVRVPGRSGRGIVINASDGTLVRKEGERVLVEIIADFEPLRLWRWLPATVLLPRCGQRGIGSIDLCDSGGGADKHLHGAVLAAPAPLSPAPDEPPLMVLPVGTSVVWDQERNGLRRVLIRWPNTDWSKDWTVELVGFVPSSALRRAPAPTRAKSFVEMPNWALPFAPPWRDVGEVPEP